MKVDSDGASHDDALNSILVHLRGREHLFAKLRETFNPTQVTIYGGVYVRPEQPQGLWLDPDQMKLLGACGVGWGVDLLVEDVPS